MVNPEEADALQRLLDSLPDNANLSRAIIQACIDAQLPQGGFAFSPNVVTQMIAAIINLEAQVQLLQDNAGIGT